MDAYFAPPEPEPGPQQPQSTIIGGSVVGTVQEADDSAQAVIPTISTNGQLTIVDPDPGEAGFVAGVFEGTYGDLTIDADGAWVYKADNRQTAIQILDDGETLEDVLRVRSLDGTEQDITITIEGRNEPVSGSFVFISRISSDGINDGVITATYDADARINDSPYTDIQPRFLLDVAYNIVRLHGEDPSKNLRWKASTLELEFSAISTIHAARIVDDPTWPNMSDPVLSIDGNRLTIQLSGISDHPGPWNFELDWIA